MKPLLWIGTVALLLVSTFGLRFCILFWTFAAVFILGGFFFKYLNKKDGTDVENMAAPVKKVLRLSPRKREKYKVDIRLTGSNLIDEQLQIILDYVFRDYVHSWYYKISDDEEFLHEIHSTLNKIIVRLSNRIKDVDWIPYLTTQLVDDVASHLKLYKQARLKSKWQTGAGELENAFFDLEFLMENNESCRDHICLNSKQEKAYLRCISEAILYQLLSESDFHCKMLRSLTREVLTELVLAPLFAAFSDPDCVNKTIVWLCSDFPISPDMFLTVLKTTNNIDELYATCATLQNEIQQLKCLESEGNHAARNKSHSLSYLHKIAEGRLHILQEGPDRDSTGVPACIDYGSLLAEDKLVELSFEFILQNSLALSYFIDYMTCIGKQAYIFAYLNMQGWRMSAASELAKMDLENDDIGRMESTREKLKETARALYQQYLSEKANGKLPLDTELIRSLYIRIHNETPSKAWFEDIVQELAFILQMDEKFFKSFQTHSSYVKLLAELELLKEPLCKSDEEDGCSVVDDEKQASSWGESCNNSPHKAIHVDAGNTENDEADHQKCDGWTLYCKIIETGLIQSNGKQFGVYAVEIAKIFENGDTRRWHVYRRYSDFYELHQKLKEKFPAISNVPFPGKKTFNNMDRNVLEARMKMLNEYLAFLTSVETAAKYSDLPPVLSAFFEGGEYDKGAEGGQFSKKVDNFLINPLKVVGNAVKTVPDNIMNTMDGMIEGFSKVFQKPFKNEDDEEEYMKVGAVLDAESDDNIPLRIMLLLMTEVFDLKTRNQWLRRQIIALLRQLMHAMFGDIVNRRILDYVAVITSPQRVAQYLANIRNIIWPDNTKKEATPIIRDHDVRMKTRVAAKCALLSSFPEELKRILGSETSRTGLMLVFSLLQHDVLNKRLMCVLVEGICKTLFPDTGVVFKRLHAQSPRYLFHAERTREKKTIKKL